MICGLRSRSTAGADAPPLMRYSNSSLPSMFALRAQSPDFISVIVDLRHIRIKVETIRSV